MFARVNSTLHSTTMRELIADIAVHAPSDFALAFLASHLDARTRSTTRQALQLRFPLQRLADGLALEKPVSVRLKYVADRTGHRRVVTIDWKPDGGGPFPKFQGEISTAPRDTETCALRLSGTYTAPGGVAGKIFDAVVGVRIAQATLDVLQDQFRDAIEADYRVRTAL